MYLLNIVSPATDGLNKVLQGKDRNKHAIVNAATNFQLFIKKCLFLSTYIFLFLSFTCTSMKKMPNYMFSKML